MLALALCSYGQKEANWWFFGTAGGLDFNCSPPMRVHGVPLYMEEGCATISDANGNFLFTTNGATIWDRDLNPMPNGQGLAGTCQYYPNSITQPALIVPKPGSSDLYYVFTVDCVEDTLLGGMRYSIVDMSLNGGLGDVTLKDQLLFVPACEKLAGMKHGSNYWIIAHEFGTNNFYAYELTSTGLSSPIVSSTGQVHYYTPISAIIHIPEQIARGHLKFSSDGSKLVALAVPDEYDNDRYVLHPEVFSFNSSNGAIESQYVLPQQDSMPYYGASFSPDGSKLYLSSAWYEARVDQFDLLAGSVNDIVNSRTWVNLDSLGNTNNAGALQLASDGKLYIATGDPWLDAIEQPNEPGLDCAYRPQAAMLSVCPITTYVNWGLPNFVESYFQTIVPGAPCMEFMDADFSADGYCFNDSTYFQDASTSFPEPIAFWKWDFDDPASGAANFSDLQHPSHQFTSMGQFDVRLIVLSDTIAVCKSDTLLQSIVIESCEGLEDRSLSELAISVFPNPSSQGFEVRILSSVSARIQLSIFDVTGRVVEHWEDAFSGAPSRQVGTAFRSGSYLLRLRSENSTYDRKLVVF